MTVLAASERGGYRARIGFEFGGESLERLIRRFTVYLSEHFVLKVGVIDTGNAAG